MGPTSKTRVSRSRRLGVSFGGTFNEASLIIPKGTSNGFYLPVNAGNPVPGALCPPVDGVSYCTRHVVECPREHVHMAVAKLAIREALVRIHFLQHRRFVSPFSITSPR